AGVLAEIPVEMEEGPRAGDGGDGDVCPPKEWTRLSLHGRCLLLCPNRYSACASGGVPKEESRRQCSRSASILAAGRHGTVSAWRCALTGRSQRGGSCERGAPPRRLLRSCSGAQVREDGLVRGGNWRRSDAIVFRPSLKDMVDYMASGKFDIRQHVRAG